MRDATQHGIQGNALVGVEPMVNAYSCIAAMTREGFFFQEFATAHFGLTVRKTATRQTQRQVSMRTQRVTDAQLRVQIHRGNRQPQRKVGL